jgi:alanyl-tRNA synthetase
MKELSSEEIRQRFLNFFEKRGHAVIPSAPLVPINDSSVLFNTAGMQPLVPFLLGQPHPKGKRLVNFQKCIRTNDIDEVGDNTHLTFFEMLGNWSLGAPVRSDGSIAPASDGTGYWKEESINWSYELLTSKEEGFGLDPQRLYVTCFEGDGEDINPSDRTGAPKDNESADVWKKIFEKNSVTGERIYFRPKEKNWWSAGENGPCGPDTEMFYDVTGKLNKGMSLEEYLKADQEQNVVEIWNNVFMEYLSKDTKVVGKLENKNVDTGAGFERMVAVIQNKKSFFETDIFSELISTLPSKYPDRSKRILADHIRTISFLVSEGIKPSNKDRGYVLRRLLRRVLSQINLDDLKNSVAWVTRKYNELEKTFILNVIDEEWNQFSTSLELGKKELNKFERLSTEDAFKLYSSFGLPFEIMMDKFPALKREEFEAEVLKHQQISRAGAEKKFKGGLSGTGEMETRYHTSAHLLHQALRDILDPTILCKGSNITTERLRFDFPFDRKLTLEEIKEIENLINQKIKNRLPINKILMKKEDAEKTGALHIFNERYPDEVNVYYIGDNFENAYSKEFCGGPHVSNTSELGYFKIVKEEAVSSGVRRIKAILE